MNTHRLTWKRMLHQHKSSAARFTKTAKKKKAAILAGGSNHNARFQVRTRQKSARLLWDLVIVFLIFAVALVFTSVLDLHGTFEAASIQLRDSPFQYDELVVALGIMAAALSAFAVRRWRELEVEIDERLGVEDALSVSEERYRTLAEAAQDFIFILGADRHIRYINSYAAGQLAIPVEKIVGESGDDVLPAGMLGHGEFDLREIFDKGRSLHVDNQAVFAGRETWQSTALVPIFDELGKVDTVLGISRDITKRKLAEDELKQAHDGLELTVAERTGELKSVNLRLQTELDEKQKAEERLQAVNRALRTAKAANHALVSASGEPELLRDICRAVVEVGGYRFAWVGFAEDDEEKTIRPVAMAGFEKGYLETVRISWDDGEMGRGPSGVAVRTARPSVVRDTLTDPGFAPWREEAGRRGFASVVSLPLSTNGQTFGVLNIYASEQDAFDDEEVGLLTELAGDLSYGIGAFRTRGERDEQAVTLRRTGEQLSLLLESLPIIFYTGRAEDDFGITYVSNNVRMLAGYSPEEITSDVSFWVDRIHPNDAPRIFEGIEKMFDRSLHEYEYRWRTAGGSYKWFLDIHRMVKAPDGASGSYIVGMWLDITSRKSGEEALLKVKEELEATAARREDELDKVRTQLARNSQELDQARCLASLLARMEEMLQSCLERSEALAVFTQFAGELFPGDSGGVYVYDEKKETYEQAAVWGDGPPAATRFDRDDCWSLRQQQPHIVIEQSTGTRCRHLQEEAPYLCVPLKAAGQAIGVLNILAASSSDDGGKAMNARTGVAREAAEHLSMALYNLKLREILTGKSIKDPFAHMFRDKTMN